MERNRETARSLGDLAVDGLLRGVIAGLIMMAVLLLAALLDDVPLMTATSRFDLTESGNPAAGLLAHLAISVMLGAVWGVLYGVVLQWLPLPAWLLGVAYGLVLYVGMTILVGDMTGLTDFATWQLLIAHGVFGLTLGVLSGRSLGHG